MAYIELKTEASDNPEFDKIRAGSRVTVLTPQGQERSGTAVMYNAKYGTWVLNMGGPHGTPGMASPKNTVKTVVRKPTRAQAIIAGWAGDPLPKESSKTRHIEAAVTAMMEAEKEPLGDAGKTMRQDDVTWSFDLTTFRTAEGFRKVLALAHIPEKGNGLRKRFSTPEGVSSGFVWIGPSVSIATMNNPITGEYFDAGGRDKEVGYASYLAVRGNPRKVREVCDLIDRIADVKDFEEGSGYMDAPPPGRLGYREAIEQTGKPVAVPPEADEIEAKLKPFLVKAKKKIDTDAEAEAMVRRFGSSAFADVVREVGGRAYLNSLPTATTRPYALKVVLAYFDNDIVDLLRAKRAQGGRGVSEGDPALRLARLLRLHGVEDGRIRSELVKKGFKVDQIAAVMAALKSPGGSVTEAAMTQDARDFISKEISHLIKDKGYSQQRAIAAAHSVAREKGYKVPANPNESVKTESYDVGPASLFSTLSDSAASLDMAGVNPQLCVRIETFIKKLSTPNTLSDPAVAHEAVSLVREAVDVLSEAGEENEVVAFCLKRRVAEAAYLLKSKR